MVAAEEATPVSLLSPGIYHCSSCLCTSTHWDAGLSLVIMLGSCRLLFLVKESQTLESCQISQRRNVLNCCSRMVSSTCSRAIEWSPVTPISGTAGFQQPKCQEISFILNCDLSVAVFFHSGACTVFSSKILNNKSHRDSRIWVCISVCAKPHARLMLSVCKSKPVNKHSEGAWGAEVSCYQQPHPSDPFPCLGLA